VHGYSVPKGASAGKLGTISGRRRSVPPGYLVYRICKRLGLKLAQPHNLVVRHGLHCRKRLSGRYETILWFTKSDEYVFNLDAIRVPQKIPREEYFKGAKAGQYSCNPLGKNPGIFGHPKCQNTMSRKHPPCQFRLNLWKRLVLALTNPGDLVVDPYMGVGSAACAAVLHGRRAAVRTQLPSIFNCAREGQASIPRRLRTRPLGVQFTSPQQATGLLNARPTIHIVRLSLVVCDGLIYAAAGWHTGKRVKRTVGAAPFAF